MNRLIADLNAALEGRYTVERSVGEGGMATVYLAEDLRHGRKVAMKVLRPDLTAALGADRFHEEIRTTANLLHPHILPLFDSGEAAGLLYYTMPYVEGQTLRQRLKREGRLPVHEALRIASHVAGALQAAHDALRALRGALRHGFINHPNLAVHSKVLEPLRSHAGFQALLAEIEPRWRALLDWEKRVEA